MRLAARGKFHGSANSFAEDICGPGGQNGERHLAAGQAVHNFIHRAVASAHDHQLPRFLDGAARHGGGLAGSRRVLKLRFDSGVAENAARLVQLAARAGRRRPWD